MPSIFVPARNSRHRTACFALYKALAQRARRVPLPNHVTYPVPDKPYVSPILRFIRHSFQQNRADTSPRLVLAALNSGYKFVELLDAAQTADSPAHKSIVDFLERRPPPKRPPPAMRGKVQRAAKQARKRLRKEQGITADDKKPRQPPVIIRRIIPGSEKRLPDGTATHIYDYVPGQGPRPLSELPGGVEHGRRFVPRLVSEVSGIPFLRMGKPQSPILSRALRFKIAKRQQRQMLASAMRVDLMAQAEDEDLWETNLAKALIDSGEPDAKQFAKETAKEPTFRSAVMHGYKYLNGLLNLETADMLLRSKAYLRIVDRERELAAKEEIERQARRKQKEKEEASK